MKKLIELTPEWILIELSQSLYANGSGVVSLDTYSASDASWIKLALSTLMIPYTENEYGEGDMIFIDIPQDTYLIDIFYRVTDASLRDSYDGI